MTDVDLMKLAVEGAEKAACKKLDSLDLEGCTMYTTIEPCSMCLGWLTTPGVKQVCIITSKFPLLVF